MAEYKIYSEENYLFIVDEQGYLFDYSRYNVEINRMSINSDVYAITCNSHPIIPAIAIGNILKKDGSHYTLEEFETFRLSNTAG